MNIEDVAFNLDGVEYGLEIDPAKETRLKNAGIVVVFGASDDLMEFRGAIHDEVGCFDGGSAIITEKGLEENRCDCGDDCPNFRSKGIAIDAEWACVENYSWAYKTEIPHACFDVVEDGNKYCRGIVFDLNNLGSTP